MGKDKKKYEPERSQVWRIPYSGEWHVIFELMSCSAEDSVKMKWLIVPLYIEA